MSNPVVIPKFEDLGPDLQKIFDPQKAKLLPMIAKGAAPIPPQILVSAWCYMIECGATELADTARDTLLKYPEAMLKPVLQGSLPAWALYTLGKLLSKNEDLLECILLNEASPQALFVEVASICSERMTLLIVNNQERIIESPEIVRALESNPRNLKSNTDRLRHFLKLAGVVMPGEASESIELMAMDEAALEKEFLESLGDPDKEDKMASFGLSDEQRTNLMSFIMNLSIGAKIKLAFKGNREARQILIRDTNKLVALAVLKSPRINEMEIAFYAGIKNICEDVIRAISVNPIWTKHYPVKLALCHHPKTPFQQSVALIKFLNLRDLTKLTKDRNIPGPLQKASKQLLSVKRK